MEARRKQLTVAERADWLRLARTKSVGPRTFRRLLARYGSAAAAIEALPELSRRGGARPAPKVPDRESAAAELAAVERAGGTAIALCEPG